MSKTVLVNFINTQHKLSLLTRLSDLNSLANEFHPLNGEVGIHSKRIRTLVLLLLLNQLYGLDDDLVIHRHIDNSNCWQFWGEICFLYKYPFDRNDFVHFHRCIKRKDRRMSSNRA